MTDIPTTEPARITAGDYVQWKISLADYKASDSWTLTYSLVKKGTRIEITATASGDDHLVTLAAATTATYNIGIYAWQAYVTKSSERYMVDRGTLEVLPNYAAMPSGYDARSHVKKTLDALEAMLEGRATKDEAAIIIGGDTIGKMPIHRLLEWRDKYLAYYAQEKQAERVANELGHDGNIYVRFEDA